MNYGLFSRDRTLWTLLAVTLLLAGLTSAQPAYSTVIVVDVPGDPLEEGQAFVFRMSVDDTEDDLFGGFEARLQWNLGDLAVDDVDFGGLLGDEFDSLQISEPFADGVNIVQISFLFDDELALLQGGSNGLELFSVGLVATTSGAVLIDWTLDLISADGLGLETFIGASAVGSSPTPVPAPGTPLLLGSALLAMLWYRRGRKQVEAKA